MSRAGLGNEGYRTTYRSANSRAVMPAVAGVVGLIQAGFVFLIVLFDASKDIYQGFYEVLAVRVAAE